MGGSGFPEAGYPGAPGARALRDPAHPLLCAACHRTSPGAVQGPGVKVTIFSMARCVMNRSQQLCKWIILLVAYDDPEIEAEVIKERIGADDDEEMAAFLRGAELVAVMGDEQEAIVE